MALSFGENLRRIREQRGMTQEDLAAALNTSKQVISRYERSERDPKISTAVKIANGLGVSLLELQTGVKLDPDFISFGPEEVRSILSGHVSVELDHDELRLVTLYRNATDAAREIAVETLQHHQKSADSAKTAT